MKFLNRSIALSSLALVSAVALSACGSSSSDSGGGGAVAAKSVSAAPPSSGCGSFTLPPAKDPDGVVAGLPANLKANYAGFPFTVDKSVWSNWKPKHGPPYNVGISWAQLLNPFQRNITNALKATLKKNPDIGKTTFLSTGTTLDVTQQLQQLQSLINAKPDIIVLEELQPNAYVKPIEEAGKQGIPVIVVVDSVASKYAVNVNYNNVRVPAQTASIAARQIGGKGNITYARGIPGVGVDTLGAQGFDEVLKNCPNIKKVGDVYGNFVEATAKSENLKFLATHPEPISGVWTVAGTTQGIMDAYKQSGRPVPTVADVGASKRSLAYWQENYDSYRGAAAVVPEISIGLRTGDIASRMLAGDGIKFSQIIGNMPLVTDSNLDQFAQKDWTFTTPGDPFGPPNGFLSPTELGSFFSKPATN